MQGAVPYNPKKDFYKPTYRKLLDYNNLIENRQGLGMLIMKPNLDLVLKKIQEIVKDYKGEISNLAKYLKDVNSFEQTYYNIWHFCKFEIRYKLDKAGIEQIRKPLQTFEDRKRGVDCEDYVIFCAALLKDLGVKSNAITTSYDNSKTHTHIYLKTGIYTIDPVWSNFNDIPFQDRITEEKTWTLH